MEIKDLAGLSTPANTLIERCADAIGAFAHPYQLVRIASAEAKVEVIKAKASLETEKIKRLGEIELASEVEVRALERLAHVEGKRQANMESIIEQAIPQLKPDAKPENVEQDWLDNFFDKCRLTSDEEMQAAWAKLLAGEANSPGSYSKRTVNLLQSLSKQEAEQFQTLARFSVSIESYRLPIVYDPTHSVYEKAGIDVNLLRDLQGAGLLDFTYQGSFKIYTKSNNIVAHYFNQRTALVLKEVRNSTIQVGCIYLTNVGLEMISLCQIKPIPDFKKYLLETWKAMGYRPTPIVEKRPDYS